MPYKNTLFLFCISFLSIFQAFAQGSQRVSGIIKDKFNEPLVGASVQLLDETGKTVVGGLAELDGSFAFTDISSGRYTVKISYIGYQDYERPVTVAGEHVVLGLIKMTDSRVNALQEVQITAQAVAVQQRGDTTQMNAGSYKVNPDATAEDLIRKMPGMDLTGSPKAQGEAITKVLVDGKPFFGDDPSASLKNLPAEIIDKVQVYDEKSEQAQFTGFDDGNTTKTINIITRPDSKAGTFGKVYAGYGYEDKYSGGGNLNYFKGDRRVTLLGLFNNINVQNFSEQDLVGAGAGGGRGGRGGPGRRDNNFMVDPTGGVARTNAVGLNYSDVWAKKIEVTGSYFFNNRNNLAEEDINRQYILRDQVGQSYLESSRTEVKNFNHRFNLRMNYTIDSNNSILFIPRLSLQNNNSVSAMQGSTFQNGSDVLNQTTNTVSSHLTGYRAAAIFLYRHKFKKPGRTFSLWMDGDYKGRTGNSSNFAENVYADPLLNNTLDQEADIRTGGWEADININYTEPLGEHSGIQVRYNVEIENEQAEKRTFNYSGMTDAYSELDTLLSNEFTSTYLTNKAGLAYRLQNKDLRLSAGLNAQNARLINERNLPQAGTYERSFNNLLPYAFLSYQFSRDKRLRFFYRARTQAPRIEELQDVIDNENPLQLRQGNPLLDQAVNHRLRFHYNATNPDKSSTFFVSAGGEFTRDYVGNATFIAPEDTLIQGQFILPRGAQLIRTENMPGYWSLNSFSTYGFPVNVLKSNLNVNAQANFERTPGRVNDALNFANNTNIGLGFTLSSNISEKVDFTLSSTGSYNWVVNTLNREANNEFYNQQSRLNLNYIFWKGLVLNSDLTHQLYTGLSEGYNQNFFLWNVGFGKKLFKKQQGEIRLSVFDLLAQNQSIQRQISEIYSQDVRTNVLQRYFMLTFTYNIRHFTGGASETDMRQSNGPGEFH